MKSYAYMLKHALRTISVALLVMLTGTFVFGASPNEPKGKFRRAKNALANQYIVVLKDDVAVANKAELVDRQAIRLGAAHGGRIDRLYHRALKGFSIRLSEAQALKLSQDPQVEFIEEDGIAQASTVQYSPPWGLDRIDQRNLALNAAYDNSGLTGSGVTVYVLDTGINTSHQEFGGRAAVSVDYVGDGLNGQDGNGHGTHVAGTIGGATYGVAKNVALRSVRVLDNGGSGAWSQIIAGIEWVTANRSGPSVANMSLTGPANDSVDQAVRNSIASGVTYVIAAGNDGSDAEYYSPARVGQAIVVGATTSADARASFSNYGNRLDMFAPGVGILSAWIGSTTATNTIDGTSMAAPHVAGLAALYLQTHPSASASTVHNTLVNAATPSIVTNPGWDTINCLAYLDSAWTQPGGGTNAVTYNGADTSTQGNWKGVYGTDGYDVYGASASLPGYASVSYLHTSSWIFADPAGASAQALEKPGASTERIAACKYSGSNGDTFTVDVTVSGGVAKSVSFYLLDWNGSNSRAQTVQALDGDTGAVLNTQASVGSFSGGKWLKYSVTGHVKFTFTRTAGDNAVVSGIFFGGVNGNTATFTGIDTSTQGSWKGVLGSDGYSIIGVGNSLPGYATLSYVNASTYILADPAGAVAQALQKPGASTDRIAACLYSSGGSGGDYFVADLNVAGGTAKQVSLYLWDLGGANTRQVTVQALDGDTDTVLNTQSVGTFSGGKWIKYQVKGHVKFKLSRVSGDNAVLSGVLFQ